MGAQSEYVPVSNTLVYNDSPATELRSLSNQVDEVQKIKTNKVKLSAFNFGDRFEKYVEKLCTVDKNRKYAKLGHRSHTYRVKVFVFGDEYWKELKKRSESISNALHAQTGFKVAIKLDRYDHYNRNSTCCCYECYKRMLNRRGNYVMLGGACVLGIGLIALPAYFAYNVVKDSCRAYAYVTVSW